jgi:hypothetical protein
MFHGVMNTMLNTLNFEVSDIAALIVHALALLTLIGFVSRQGLWLTSQIQHKEHDITPSQGETNLTIEGTVGYFREKRPQRPSCLFPESPFLNAEIRTREE